ncbi:hypothetical protein BT93_F2534 [Corymbia citriodora subsp. variegata]|nr:hypothetical protein BT93_F2534 [Corymbia citriodora subsp. variegata]
MDNDEASSATEAGRRPREELRATVHVVRRKPDKTPPLVGFSTYCIDPSSRPRGGSAEPEVKVYRHSEEPDELKLVVRPPEYNFAFVGSVKPRGSLCDSRHPRFSDCCTFALGVLDRESQTLKIVPIAFNTIFNMVPRYRSDLAEKERTEWGRGELSAKEKADKILELNLLYGTKGSIAQAKRMQSLRQKDYPNSQKGFG